MNDQNDQPIPSLDPETLKKMQEILWGKIKELQIKRNEAFKKHAEWYERMAPKMTQLGRETNKGCADAAELASKIDSIIEVGQMLGLIGRNVKSYNHYDLSKKG